MRRSNEVSVGILITVSVVVLVLGTLWLVRGGLKSGYPLYTRFAWGQNLKQGQPVLLAGVTVGYVGDVAVALTLPVPPPETDYAPGDTVPSGTPAADVDQIMSRVDSIGATT